ncbi:MAG: hypothetical protein ACM33B_08080 [Pseudomonadota bacterium]
MRRASFVSFVVAAAAAVVLVPAATADQTFHTLHADLHAVGSAPLRSGFVNDIHTEGVVNAAHEIYHLNGATPGTTYQVTILLYLGDPSCSSAPLMFPTATVETNGAGNGNADFTFPAGPPSGIEGIESGIRWQLSTASGVAYATHCAPLTID